MPCEKGASYTKVSLETQQNMHCTVSKIRRTQNEKLCTYTSSLTYCRKIKSSGVISSHLLRAATLLRSSHILGKYISNFFQILPNQSQACESDNFLALMILEPIIFFEALQISERKYSQLIFKNWNKSPIKATICHLQSAKAAL